MKKTKSLLCVGLLMTLALTGCARSKELQKVNHEQARTIVSLNEEISQLNAELDALREQNMSLDSVRRSLEEKLKTELAGGDLTLAMGERGLVLTVLDRVLFDSGKAEIKESAAGTLSKVNGVLNNEAAGNLIFVEGHTDNDPIVRSGWKSNWELSTARATEVIHQMIDTGAVSAERLVATGYGEFRPVAPNDTNENKEMNRRVEIVISPRKA